MKEPLKAAVDNHGDIIKAARQIGLISRSQQLFCHIDRRMEFSERTGCVEASATALPTRRCTIGSAIYSGRPNFKSARKKSHSDLFSIIMGPLRRANNIGGYSFQFARCLALSKRNSSSSMIKLIFNRPRLPKIIAYISFVG